MAVHSGSFLSQSMIPKTGAPAITSSYSWRRIPQLKRHADIHFSGGSANSNSSSRGLRVLALERSSSSSSSSSNDANKKTSVPNSNYVVPLDKSPISSCITRPLAEILRDLNKRIPDNIIKLDDDIGGDDSTFIPWYHANRMLSFYAPGWCGEIRDVIFSDNGSVTVVYRVTIRGSDGEVLLFVFYLRAYGPQKWHDRFDTQLLQAHRESTGTVSSGNDHTKDPVAAAEEIAFCRACARFGLGLYLYHEE